MLQENARLPNKFMDSNVHSGPKIQKSCHLHIPEIENYWGLSMASTLLSEIEGMITMTTFTTKKLPPRTGP
jgi:hypothetical protein